MTSYNSPNQSKLVMICSAKHVDTNTVFPFRRNHITWMRNDEFESMFGMNDKTSKDIQKKHDRAIHVIHLPGTTYKILWHEWGTHQHPWPKITYFRAIVSWIIMSPVTWWVVCRVRTYEQYRCYVVVDSWFRFSAVMFFVTRFFSNVDIKSTRIWWDNIWPKDRILLLCIYEFHGTQTNTAQHCRCSQKSWFKTAQRDRCSFGTWRQ